MRFFILFIILTSCSTTNQNNYFGYERKNLMKNGNDEINKNDIRLPLIWYVERLD